MLDLKWLAPQVQIVSFFRSKNFCLHAFEFMKSLSPYFSSPSVCLSIVRFLNFIPCVFIIFIFTSSFFARFVEWTKTIIEWIKIKVQAIFSWSSRIFYWRKKTGQSQIQNFKIHMVVVFLNPLERNFPSFWSSYLLVLICISLIFNT